jgi:hypothetical protein
LWQIVRKPNAELSRQPYRDAENISYPSKQNRFESYPWITNRFIEQLNRGLASFRSPFELWIARAQALLSATVEIIRLVLEDDIAHPNLSPNGLLLDIGRFLPNR